MKKSLLIAGMLALGLTACQYGQNSPDGAMIQAKMACKAEGKKTADECELLGREAYVKAGGFAKEMEIYEMFKGKKGMKMPKKPAWLDEVKEEMGMAPAAAPAEAAPAEAAPAPAPAPAK